MTPPINDATPIETNLRPATNPDSASPIARFEMPGAGSKVQD